MGQGVPGYSLLPLGSNFSYLEIVYSGHFTIDFFYSFQVSVSLLLIEKKWRRKIQK